MHLSPSKTAVFDSLQDGEHARTWLRFPLRFKFYTAITQKGAGSLVMTHARIKSIRSHQGYFLVNCLATQYVPYAVRQETRLTKVLNILSL